MDQIKNKIAIVTGAGTGIGEATARAFVEAGARTVFVGRRLEKLQGAARGLDSARLMLRACDVADRTAVDALGAEVAAAWGGVDILVNNAGTNTNPRAVGAVDPEDWDHTIAINLTGVFNMVRAVLPGMRQKEDGVIITVSSIAGLRASKLAGAAYSASKHGAVALTHSINEEEVAHGIRACAICPGEVETPILEKRPEPVSAARRAAMLQPEELAQAALFVASLPPRACVPLLIIKPTTQLYQ
ncbi:MAG: SDR family oxidoreductase [Candidatus Latescibacteria bacterium]|jgi:NADP-dependent 3-hydroxy acid dehydrogenase YdfG|nr:SDR family oxidoreductase [Candidatus Latescibacterota bacterium]